MDKATIKKLGAAPIELIGRVSTPGGQSSITLKASELEVFCEDPEGFYAMQHGVAKEVYQQWVETEGTPRCGAKTTQGVRCRNVVSGGIQMNLERWLQEDGGLCTVHGGATSAEARNPR